MLQTGARTDSSATSLVVLPADFTSEILAGEFLAKFGTDHPVEFTHFLVSQKIAPAFAAAASVTMWEKLQRQFPSTQNDISSLVNSIQLYLFLIASDRFKTIYFSEKNLEAFHVLQAKNTTDYFNQVEIKLLPNLNTDPKPPIEADHEQVIQDYLENYIQQNMPSPAEAASWLAPTDAPLVSICIAHFNHGAFLPVLLDSLNRTHYANLEVIIVDDGSTNADSLRVFHEYREKLKDQNIHFFEKQNGGPGSARNYAAEQASGDYLIFMDADNLATDSMVDDFMLAITKSKADCITSWFFAFDEYKPSPDTFPVYMYNPIGGKNFGSYYLNTLGDTNFCIKKEVFRALGGFMIDRSLCLEDWEFLTRLILRDFHLEVVPKPLFWYRHSESGWGKTKDQMRSIEYLRKNFTRESPGDLYEASGYSLSPADIEPKRSIPYRALRKVYRFSKRILGMVKNRFLIEVMTKIRRKIKKYLDRPVGPSRPQIKLSSFPKYRKAFEFPAEFGTSDTPSTIRNIKLLNYHYGRYRFSLRLRGKNLSDSFARWPTIDYPPLKNIQLGVNEEAHFSGKIANSPHLFKNEIGKHRPGTPTFIEFKKQKPVVFVVPVYLAMGGVEKNAVEILAALKSDFDFVVIGLEPLRAKQGNISEQFESSAVAVYELGEMFEAEHRLTVLEHLKATYQPDVMWICNGSPWLVEQLPAFRTLFADTPIVDQLVYDVNEGWIQAYDQAFIQKFDSHIATTEKIRKKFVETLHIPDAKVKTIYSCLNTARFNLDRHPGARLPVNDRPVRLASIGRFNDQKNPLALLSLIKSLGEQGVSVELTMVGDGEMRNAIEKRILRLGLKNVKLAGFQSDLLPIYQKIDALFFTSRFEGLPIAMLEALCCGVPVFSTDVGDIENILTTYQSGKVSKAPAGSAEFAQDAKTFLSAIDTWKKQAQAGAPQVRERFSSATISKQYQDLWLSLMRQK